MKTWTLGLTSIVVSVCFGLSACGDDNSSDGGDTGGSSSEGGTGSGDAGDPGDAGESSTPTTGGNRSTGGASSTSGGTSTGNAGESSGNAGETSSQAGEPGTDGGESSTGGMSSTGGTTGGGGEPSAGGTDPGSCELPDCLLELATLTVDCAPSGDCVSESIVDPETMIPATINACYDNGVKTQEAIDFETFEASYTVQNADGSTCYSFAIDQDSNLEFLNGDGDVVATVREGDVAGTSIITCDGQDYTLASDCPDMGEGGAGNIPTMPPATECVEGTCEF